MRDIRFKAKRTDNGEWVEGNLLRLETDFFTDNNDTGYMYYIIPTRTNGSWCKQNFALKFISPCYEVDPSTLCQYTGLTDKNGKKIWENDIVETIYDGKQNPNYVVVWDMDELDFKATNGKEHYKTNYEYLGCCDEIVFIGNIFDNPELLEGE